MRLPSTPLVLLLLLGGATLTGGCARLRGHTGYVADPQLVNSVQPGVDNRDSVLKVLGTPNFASQFNKGDWYYVARDTRYYAYNNPHPTSQVTIRISFDQSGTVTAVRRSGMEQVATIHPDGKTTPTLGRKRGFLQDLFGNIGTVGAAGTGGDGGGNGPNEEP